tara:strand:+ start:46 stop:546 length:501 start_codon:yes stop_codon:yes gene_type:complete
MDMKYQVHKNFLAIDFFEKIKNLVMDEDFPWRRRDHMTSDNNDAMYFNHCFYNQMMPMASGYEPFIIPILKKLQAEAPIQIGANMFINSLFKASGWHTDCAFKCKTAILYLNECDGGTELKINNKITFIKADANKMLIFDTPILHRAITSKKEPIRYIINFNYFIS